MPAPSLFDRLAELPDPRDPRGCTYPLVSLVALAVVALLAGHTSLTAIAQFGRLRGHKLGHALGFRDGHMPCPNTFANLFAALEADHLDRIIAAWLNDRHPDGHDHLALDGKVLRGSRDGERPGVHLLAAYAPQVSAVVAQMTVEATTNEHKAALRLLGVLPLGGAVVTADAMFTHPDVAQQILDAGGDYVLYAKRNQKELRADLEATFTAAEGGDFSPRGAGRLAGRCAGGHVAGEGARAGGAADDHHQHLAGGVPDGLAGGGAGVPPGARANRAGEDDGGGGVRGDQPGASDRRRRAGARAEPGALGDRERVALPPRRDVPRGPLPGATGKRPAGVGLAPERGGVPAPDDRSAQPARRHPPDGRPTPTRHRHDQGPTPNL
jgi:DDE_Tnp_1-associated/Transposase DDE domain